MSALLRLSIVHDVRDEVGVAIETTNRPTFAISADGRRWIRKAESSTGVQGLVAEATSWLLGREIGAPIPDGGIAQVDGELSWLSLRVDPVIRWRPELAYRVRNLGSLGAAVALDAIVMNSDSNSGNVLLQPVRPAPDLRAWSIDYSEALIGHVDDAAALGSDPPVIERAPARLPLELVSATAAEAALRAAAVPLHQLRSIVAEAFGAVGGFDSGLLLSVLERRCRNAPAIVTAHLAALGAQQ